MKIGSHYNFSHSLTLKDITLISLPVLFFTCSSGIFAKNLTTLFPIQAFHVYMFREWSSIKHIVDLITLSSPL